MFTNLAELAKTIDHTVLAPDVTLREIERACENAGRYGFAAVCIPPCYVKTARRMLRGTNVGVCTVIGFPFGYQTTAIKVAEASESIQNGASEVDVVINLGAVKSGDAASVKNELRMLRAVIRNRLLRVILETGYLSRSQMVAACRWTRAARVDWVKTSTGFGPRGATARDVRLLKKMMGDNGFVKAAGGIRDLRMTVAMIRAGAARIGTSRGVQIVTEYMENRDRL